MAEHSNQQVLGRQLPRLRLDGRSSCVYTSQEAFSSYELHIPFKLIVKTLPNVPRGESQDAIKWRALLPEKTGGHRLLMLNVENGIVTNKDMSVS